MKRLKPRNPVSMVKKMRPEQLMGIGYQIQYLRQGVSATLLGQIYSHLTPHIEGVKREELDQFYKEMLVGMDAQAREAGAQPKTTNQLLAFINGLEVPESVNLICSTLISLMEPPEPLDM